MLNVIFDLAALGYVVTNSYADGIVRMEKRMSPHHKGVAWLWANGRFDVRYENLNRA